MWVAEFSYLLYLLGACCLGMKNKISVSWGQAYNQYKSFPSCSTSPIPHKLAAWVILLYGKHEPPSYFRSGKWRFGLPLLVCWLIWGVGKCLCLCTAIYSVINRLYFLGAQSPENKHLAWKPVSGNKLPRSLAAGSYAFSFCKWDVSSETCIL